LRERRLIAARGMIKAQFLNVILGRNPMNIFYIIGVVVVVIIVAGYFGVHI
jgi:hypothetical protein